MEMLNIWDILILIVLCVLVAFAVRQMLRTRGTGCNTCRACGGACASCGKNCQET